jgi:hypothetical protein
MMAVKKDCRARFGPPMRSMGSHFLRIPKFRTAKLNNLAVLSSALLLHWRAKLLATPF